MLVSLLPLFFRLDTAVTAAVTAAVKAKAPTAHRRRGRKGKSVYRGVCVTREGKWRAVIYKERKQASLASNGERCCNVARDGLLLSCFVAASSCVAQGPAECFWLYHLCASRVMMSPLEVCALIYQRRLGGCPLCLLARRVTARLSATLLALHFRRGQCWGLGPS